MAAEKVKYLDIDSLLGRPKNRVVRCGVELEGAWKDSIASPRLERDASVFASMRDAGGLKREKLPDMLCGELPIGPVVPAQIFTMMKKYYPSKIDASCGMHVHMSFESLKYYMALMEPEFPATIVEYLGRWAQKESLPKDHPIWERLSGKNEYCQDKFWPDDQCVPQRKDYDHHRQGHRYTHVNYAGRTHGTIEVRTLPMMETVEQAIRAVRFVFDITNACLVKMRPADRKTKSGKLIFKLDMNANESYEERIEVVL